ncbi:MAG: VWA domain-containing protein [Bacteroidetes bacterium]|nr:VWA domain-containing protein [Bacteroidota bacterium]
MKFGFWWYSAGFLALFLVLIVIIFYRRNQKQNLAAYFLPDNLLKLNESSWLKLNSLRLTFWTLAMIFGIIALMGPLLGERTREVKHRGVDLIIGLDVSNSMLAQDVLPSRLEKAKLEIRNFVGQLNGDRVGLIVFENDAFLQCPLTSDYSAISLYLDAITTGYLPTPGTNLAAPLESADEAFKRTLTIGETQKEAGKSKIMILVSDGEDHEGSTEEAIKIAMENGIKVFTVGVGTAAGGPIPVKDRSGKVVDFKRDRTGNVVTTQLKEDGLARVADETGGEYFRIGATASDFYKLNEVIEKMTKTDFKSSEVLDLDNKFQYPLALSVFFLLANLFIIPSVKKEEEAE